MTKNLRFPILSMLCLLGGGVHAQLVLDQSLTPEQLVQDVLLGSGVQVSNITFNGVPGTTITEQAASFDGTNCNLGIPQGIMLATGSVMNAMGPNDSGSSSLGGGNFGQSDPDLLLLSGNASINDAAVLEFDFIPIGDSIQFQFVFGSDEYLEFVNSINDAFGFFLSGPNINGPYSNNSINIALIPNTTDPVTINTVNDVVNSAYYVDNGDGFTPPFNTDEQYLQFDGMTVVLTAKAAVACGQVHHIKIAVGDASDSVWDSAVFLEGGSFTSAPFVPDLQPGPGIVGTNTILESCFNVDFLFTRVGDSTFAATVNVEVGGTATPGVDYAPPFPTQLVFAPFQTTVPFTLNAPIDADDVETILITLISASDCTADSLEITFDFIIDEPDPLIAIGEAFLLDCGESVQLTPTITGGYGNYSYLWSPTSDTALSILYTPTTVSDVTVLVSDNCGLQTTGFFAVELSPPPPISATLSGPDPLIEGCDQATLSVTRPAGTSGDLLVNLVHIGSATSGVDNDLGGSIVIPGGTGTANIPVAINEDNVEEGQENMVVVVSYSNTCQQAVTDTVESAIIDAAPIVIETESLLIIPCGGDSIPLVALISGGVGSLNTQWSNGNTGSTAYVSNSIDGTYTVSVTDDCGHVAEATVVVDPQCAIIVPNVISPNGDGQNDVFFIEGILASKSAVRIFNRWGQVVYEAVNYKNNWSAPGLSDGTYFYEVKVDRDPEPHTGTLTILSNDRRP
jgi:gliding motility-associated-like protein